MFKCHVEGCTKDPESRGKSYCRFHFKQLLNGSELVMKNGKRKSFPGASPKMAQAGKKSSQKPWEKKARLVSLTTLDGESLQADMNQDQLRVFQAALVGAKFSADAEVDTQIEDSEDEDDDQSFSAIREIIGFAEQ